MNRNEIKDIIIEDIENIISCDRWYIQKRIDEYADSLLNKLEEAGMLPPVLSLCDDKHLTQKHASEMFEQAWDDYHARWCEDQDIQEQK